MTAPNRPRLDWLTALRFFAAFGVLICHLVSPYRIQGAGRDIALFGQFGVDFFFVLSGFVLTWSHKPTRSPQRFYWLRFARIWPLHAAVMCALFVLGARAPLGEVVSQLLLVQQWNWNHIFTEGLNGVSWTLSVEAFFYALFPFLIRPLHRRSTGQLIGIAAGAWIIHGVAVFAAISSGMPEAALWLVFSNPASRIGQFVIGMVIAIMLLHQLTPRHKHAQLGVPRETHRVSLFPIAGALALLAVVIGGYVLTGGGWIAFWTWAVTPVMAALVVAAAQYDIRGGRPAPRFLVKLGEWSFAMYLIHRGLVYTHLIPRLDGWPRPLAWLILWIVSFALAAIAYEWFERPVEKWLRARGPRDSSAPLPEPLLDEKPAVSPMSTTDVRRS